LLGGNQWPGKRPHPAEEKTMTLLGLGEVLYWCWLASEIAILIVTRTRSGRGEVRDRGSLVVLWLTLIAAGTLGRRYAQSHAPTMFGGAHWLGFVGLAFLVLGVAIRWTAVVSLGRSFSANVAIRAQQQLYTGGLYRLVRHPSYLGLLLVLTAIALHTHNWIGFAIVLIPSVAALDYRIHVEEEALRAAFGDSYEIYSSRTKRLIPGLY
jgi:protein-S-isoprenylcysteine O-methyltransferase Ste14